MPDAPQVLHASAVSIAGRGVLIQGASGTGKSALALALIARGASLVSDDRTELAGPPPRLAPPAAIAGLIEARGVGLIRVPCVDQAPLDLIVDLDESPVARLPHPRATRLHGVEVPTIVGRGCPGLADIVTVLVRDGRLADPDHTGPGQETAG